MASTPDPDWITAGISAAVGALGTLGVALLNSRSSLNKTIDARITTILHDDEATIKRQDREIVALRHYTVILIATLLKEGIEVPPAPILEDHQYDG